MNDPSLTPRGKRRDEEKEALDRQTAYATLLPHMDEGFHSGYQSEPGVVSDQNQRPGEWLENVARYMQTEGEDVSYSIPDVLAGEQQLRRLSRLPHEMAMRHQEMIDYRAVLALLLLWDGWAREAGEHDAWPALTLETVRAEDEGFASAVLAALSPPRAREGLRVFTLARARSETPDAAPLCLLSRAMAVVPAANPGNLSDLLPARVSWYDRANGRFTDPCERLDERDLTRLLQGLRLLQALNADADALIYSPTSSLCGLLDRFAADLLRRREGWRRRFEAGEERADDEQRVRLSAVCGLMGNGASSPVKRLAQRLDAADFAHNPLLSALLPDKPLPDSVPGVELVLFTCDGVPFARQSAAFALEPAFAPGEGEALSRLRQECLLLSDFRPEWNRETSARLLRLRDTLAPRVGVSERLVKRLESWAGEYAARPERGDRGVTLRYPLQSPPAALPTLIADMLGDMGEECLRAPFSDCLLLVEGAEGAPYEDAALSEACLLRGDEEGAPARYMVAPLSPALCAWLEAQGEKDDPCAPRLRVESLRCFFDRKRGRYEVSFCVVARAQGREATPLNAVTFQRFYQPCAQPEAGGAFAMPAHALPCVVAWPNVRLAPGQWGRYFVHAHRPDGVDVWTLTQNGWETGALRTVSEATGRARAHARTFQTTPTDRFPAYVALKRGKLSLGALINDPPRQLIKREPAAAVSVDFGSISTTVMLRQGDRVQPAVWPRRLHHTLLRASEEDMRFLADELLPENALLPEPPGSHIFYSLMDMFVDEPDRWRELFQDGHIYYRESLAALMRKGEGALYYDLKWGEEAYVLRLIRLFLKQVMTQAALSARLWGSPSISWRVSMPNALPPHRQEAYLEMVRGLAREVAAETLLPLTGDCPPVLYATENQADGLYFLGRNEISARGGYLNLDIGGGTTDLSLWLGGARHATAECSLLLGCRQMLFDSLSQWHTADFEQDFLDAPENARAAAREVARALKLGTATTRGRQKGMLLLDDFFSGLSGDIRAAMAGARSQGRMTCLEALLLFNLGYLFMLAGELLNRAWLDAELRPQLPARMELCIAGNGGQLLKTLDDQQRQKLCGMALSRLSPEHPLQALLPVQSRHPKQEVAIGLLAAREELHSALQGEERWNGTLDGDGAAPPQNPLSEYLPLFYATFPQACKRLMPGAFEEGGTRGATRLTPAALMELSTIFENERLKTPEDDMATYIRCFAGLKRLWRI